VDVEKRNRAVVEGYDFRLSRADVVNFGDGLKPLNGHVFVAPGNGFAFTCEACISVPHRLRDPSAWRTLLQFESSTVQTKTRIHARDRSPRGKEERFRRWKRCAGFHPPRSCQRETGTLWSSHDADRSIQRYKYFPRRETMRPESP